MSDAYYFMVFLTTFGPFFDYDNKVARSQMGKFMTGFTINSTEKRLLEVSFFTYKSAVLVSTQRKLPPWLLLPILNKFSGLQITNQDW